MINFEYVDPKTIKLDGETYVLLYKRNNLLRAPAYISSFRIKVIETRAVDTVRHWYAENGYYHESWGFWKFVKNENILLLVLFGGYKFAEATVSDNPYFVSEKTNKQIEKLENMIGRLNIDVYIDLPIGTREEGLPKWFRLIPFSNKYDPEDPLPHAMIYDYVGVNLGGKRVYFFDRKIIERFKKEMGIK